MISTRDLSELPDIAQLRRLSQSLAMVDAIVCPAKNERCYWFFANEESAYMYNWGGDSYSIFFTNTGAILTGFAHEATMSPYTNEPPAPWAGVWDDFPEEFGYLLVVRPTQTIESTFCIWRRTTDTAWQTGHINFPEGPDPDGSADLLSILDGRPETYQQWVQNFYLAPVDLPSVQHIYEHHPLSEALVHQLNPEAILADVEADAREIGYPFKP